VKELKAAVPSIQSDFSRLRTVAAVGEELVRLWDQEGLLVVFQGLQVRRPYLGPYLAIIQPLSNRHRGAAGAHLGGSI
jgi:hypothetical protein